MQLRSKIFNSDPAFSACLAKDSAHILPGSSGFHVACIQFALVILDGARIAQKEMNQALYGPTTANSVRNYKRRRKIINPAYQTKADNIVGKMTIAQLDSDMHLNEAIAQAAGQNIQFQFQE